MRVRSPLSMAALLAAFTLAACGDTSGDAAARDTLGTADDVAPAGTGAVHVEMEAQGNSNVTGMAMLDHASTTINASLTLNGLREGQPYTLHLSPGACGDTGERHTVKSFELQGGEIREQAITLEKSEFEPAEDDYVLIVRDAANTVVSCGEIPEHAHRTTPATPAAT